MKLVVDTNRLFAAIIRDSVSRRIFFSDKFELYSVAISRDEFKKHEKEVLQKSRLQEQAFFLLVEEVSARVQVLDEQLVKKFLPEAVNAMSSVDVTDAPFIAAALAIGADGIWSDDRHFEKQTLARLFKTGELAMMLV